ncbi:ABC-2 type transport system permease protein [Halopolyspora algeriensis]|uniref:ABC-2 type transport system permease protein n=1 Tax=Halopolyspora algeriensis TaxID=1500506 RepID=A0A368VWD1_9ACTN|nr:ABC transporter permease [Halopolyspora algeriensis]RCW43713.1 ABC-2 type transport system permease protein [Halopolyspora algeriensis]TQM47504.1 ABC-2 type transport system permease protein [Halopolyspora algeriensis]
MGSAIWALATAETKLLLRNKTVAVTAILVPLLLGFFMATGIGGSARMWALVLSMQVLFVLAFAVYFTATAAVTSRREDLYLKRLCSAEPHPAVVLAGTLLPAVVLGLLQATAMIAIAVLAGAPVPGNVVLLIVAVVGGAAMCVAAGLATSAYTATSEQAQITTMPFFLALFVGGIWAVNAQDSLPALLVPGGAVADLVRRSLTEGNWFTQVAGALPAIGMLLVWVVIAGLVARRWFRWEPRS